MLSDKMRKVIFFWLFEMKKKCYYNVIFKVHSWKSYQDNSSAYFHFENSVMNTTNRSAKMHCEYFKRFCRYSCEWYRCFPDYLKKVCYKIPIKEDDLYLGKKTLTKMDLAISPSSFFDDIVMMAFGKKIKYELIM